MKLIFLDFDGVLNNPSSSFLHYYDEGRGNFIASPDPVCVKLVDFLIKESGAFVVISSSWRVGNTVDQLKHILSTEFGLKNVDRVIGKTRNQLPEEVRGNQIEDYLWNCSEVTHYVILDDDSDMLDTQQDNFVQTDRDVGFRIKNLIKAAECLGFHYEQVF